LKYELFRNLILISSPSVLNCFPKSLKSGETIIESVISFSHSSHVDLSQMAFDIIVQFCMIDPTLAGSIVTRIQQHFAPILPTENGDNAKVEKPEKKYEVWNWQRSCQLVNIIIGDKMLSDEQCHHFVESLLHKLTSTAKEPNAHSEPIQSIVRLIYRNVYEIEVHFKSQDKNRCCGIFYLF
jgi:hypothetical protein